MNHPRALAGLSAAGLLFVLSLQCIAAELVVNGGFETGNFSGWTTTPASTGSLFGVESNNPHSGTFNAYFGATQLFPDSIRQNIPTVPGALYQVSFWLRNDGSPPNEVRVDFGGNTLADIGIQAAFPYRRFVFPDPTLSMPSPANSLYTVAAGASTTLEIKAYHSPSFWRLDDVSVTRICQTSQTGSQQFFSQDLPSGIPEGRTANGTSTRFFNEPQATSASIHVCIDDVLPQNVKVVIRPIGDTVPDSARLVLWDHEQFVDQNDQPIQHIEAVANLPSIGLYLDQDSNPPTYSYQVDVFDDQPGVFAFN
jgi:hypothetical protein